MLEINNWTYLVSSAEFWGIFKVFNATVGGRVSQGAWVWRVAIGGEHAIGVRLVSLGDCGFRFWYIADFCEKNWGKNVKRYLKRVPLLFTYLILRHLKLVAQPIVRESLQPDHSRTFWRGRNPWKKFKSIWLLCNSKNMKCLNLRTHKNHPPSPIRWRCHPTGLGSNQPEKVRNLGWLQFNARHWNQFYQDILNTGGCCRS